MTERTQCCRNASPPSDHCLTKGPPSLSSSGPITTCFQQSCPACGRGLLIRVEHLGRRVYCGHCGAPLLARHVSQDSSEFAKTGDAIAARVEQLLAGLESGGHSYYQKQLAQAAAISGIGRRQLINSK